MLADGETTWVGPAQVLLLLLLPWDPATLARWRHALPHPLFLGNFEAKPYPCSPLLPSYLQ